MKSDLVSNRWRIVIAAICMQICLGAAYGWSVFKNPLMELGHWRETAVQLNFTLIIVCFGLGTVIGGIWQDRVGPRKVGSWASILYGAGYIAAGVAASHHSIVGIYFGYGLLAGIGMGMGYICPVATLAKWFPDKRGLMTGIAVCGYGFGALIMSPVAAWEILHYGAPKTFGTLGVIYLMVTFLAAQFLINPPHDFSPPGWHPERLVAKSPHTSFTLAEALKTWQLYFLFLLLFLNISAGIMVIGQASPMAQEMVGMPVIRAAGTVGLISIFNGLGRIFWAWASDHIGRAPVYFLLYLIQAFTFFTLPRIHDWTLFGVAFALIGLCYGGGLGTMPSFAADYFGPKFMGGIYGAVLLVGNLAAIPSPILIAHIHQDVGSYIPALHLVLTVMLCALIVPLLARRPTKALTSAPAIISTD